MDGEGRQPRGGAGRLVRMVRLISYCGSYSTVLSSHYNRGSCGPCGPAAEILGFHVDQSWTTSPPAAASPIPANTRTRSPSTRLRLVFTLASAECRAFENEI